MKISEIGVDGASFWGLEGCVNHHEEGVWRWPVLACGVKFALNLFAI